MTNTATTLLNENISLKELVGTLKEKVLLEQEENDTLREQIRLLKAKLFGPKKDGSYELEGEQLAMFEEQQTSSEKPEPESGDGVIVGPFKRKKKRNRELPETLPHRHVYHQVPQQQMQCACGCLKSVIGDETTKMLTYHAPRLEVVVHHREKVACKQCQGVGGSGPTVTIAKGPDKLIAKSYATPSLIAHLLSEKFVDGLPFYRQEAKFARLGFQLGRSTMCSWAIHVADKAARVLALLWAEVNAYPYLQIDETTVQVLNEKGRANTSKSYFWVIRGGPPDRPGILFHYRPTRAAACAKELLKDFKGYVQSDGYKGYGFLDGHQEYVPLACMAHVRRKFSNVCKAVGKVSKSGKKSLARQAMHFINKLYRIEAQAREGHLSHQEIKTKREQQAIPLLEDFKSWLDVNNAKVPPRSLLGQAITYTLNQWSRLVAYTQQGFLRIDNNLVENSIRPFVIGRKGWLFAGSPEGANASAVLYSLVVTAKANGWDPHAYLRHLLEALIDAHQDEAFAKLLPTIPPSPTH